MYSDKFLDHFHNPRNVGELASPTVILEVTNAVCGDLMKVWAVIEDGRIVDVKFRVQGCVPAVARGSWLTETIRGKALNDVARITAEQIEAALDGLPFASRHAAVLAADALKQLLQRSA